MKNKRTYRLTESRLRGMIREAVKNTLNESIYEEAESNADEIANFIGYKEAFHALANLVCMENPKKLLEYTNKIKQMYYVDGIV